MSSYICGELTGDEVWLETDKGLAGFVRGIIRRNSAIDTTDADPADLRLAAAIAIGAELQIRLVEVAIERKSWSPETASAVELSTLRHARGETLASMLEWTSEELPLVFVPTNEDEAGPGGNVFTLRWENDRTLLTSLINCGFIQGGLV